VHLHLSRILHQRLSQSLHPSRNQRPNPNLSLSLSLSPHQAQQIVPVII
jgi:hypothetical protein